MYLINILKNILEAEEPENRKRRLRFDSGTNRNSTSSVFAEDLDVLKENMNAFFLIVMGCVVFLMQCGFAFLEAGSVR